MCPQTVKIVAEAKPDHSEFYGILLIYSGWEEAILKFGAEKVRRHKQNIPGDQREEHKFQ